MEKQSHKGNIGTIPASPIRFFGAALLLFALIGASFSVPSVSLGQPTANSMINTQFLRFSWTASGFGASQQCILEITGPISVRREGIPCENGLMCDISVVDLPDGIYNWNVTCNDGNQQAASASRSFTVFRPEIPITCSIGLPENEAKFPDTNPIPNVLFSWNVTGFQTAYGCILRIGTNYYSLPFYDLAEQRSYQDTVPKGTYTWDIRCYNSTRTVSCLPARSLSVVSMVLLSAPQNNSNTDRWFVDFSWKPAGLSNPTCTLNLNGANVASKACTNNADCTQRVPDLPNGNYNWYVSCAGGAETVSSDTWKFSVSRPPSTGACSLQSPDNGAVIEYVPAMDYSWAVSGFPSAHQCELIVDGSSYTTSPGSLGSEAMNLPLSPGSHTWRAYCYDDHNRVDCGQRTFTAIPSARLSSPADSQTTSAYANNFTWVVSGFTVAPSCTLYVNSVSRGSIPSCAGECGILVSGLPEGELPWNVTCSAANGERASSAAWKININYSEISILQIRPANRSIIPNTYANFSWSYSGFSSAPTCTLNLNGTVYGGPSCTAGGMCNKTIIGLREGTYAWNVTCAYGSQLRSTGNWRLDVRYALLVDLAWPIGQALGSLSNTFLWIPDGFDSPSSCVAKIYNASGSLVQTSSSRACANGAQCQYSEYNLPDGGYSWNVTCNYSLQNKSSAASPFTIKYPVSCAAVFPYASQTSRSMANDFSFNYSGFEGDPACTFTINGVSYATSCNRATKVCNKTIAGMAEGAYTWSGQCSYLSQRASTGNQLFSVGYSLLIALISPSDGTTSSAYSNTFLWEYSGFDSLPACTLYVDGAAQGAGTCNAATRQCTRGISNLAEGNHAWRVYCQNGNQNNWSATNSLRVDYSVACTLSSPQDGNISRSANMNFSWSPSGFAGSPVSCTLYLKGPSSVARAVSCTNNQLCSAAVTDLPEGPYLWNVTCNYGNQIVSSPETRPFILGYDLPIQLSSPPEGSTLSSYSNTFSWSASGFDGGSNCTAKAYNRTSGALYGSSSLVQCASGATCSADFQNLPAGDYAWNVTCAKRLQANTSMAWNFRMDYSAISTSLVSPPSGQSQSSSNTFAWSYSGFAPNNPACTLFVNGLQYPVTCASSPCNKAVANMAQGTYLWNVTCAYGNLKAASPETRSLAIAYNLGITLDDPASGEILSNYARNFSWTPSGFESGLSCTLRVYNATSPAPAVPPSSLQCVSGASCRQEVANLPAGSYLWNVTCQSGLQSKASPTYPFTVQYNAQVNVGINAPPISAPQNPVLPGYNNTAFWSVSSFDCAQPSCRINISDTFNRQVFAASKPCPAGSICNQSFSNLPEGSFTAQVSCSCNNQAGFGSAAFSVNYDSSVTLVSPANGNQSASSGMNFTWGYAQFGSTPACALYVDNKSYSSSCNSGSCSQYVSAIPEGAHTWNITCAYGNQSASSETRVFLVGYQLLVSLIFPSPGATIIDYANNFTWIPSGFDAAPMCGMRIYKSGNSTPLYSYSINCAKNSQCNQSVQNMPRGDYLWNVTCSTGIQNASSQTNAFTVNYDSSVTLVSPANGNQSASSGMNFTWGYARFASIPTCTLYVDNKSYSSSCGMGNCSQYVSAIPEGAHTWNITCAYNNQTASSEIRAFLVGYALSIILVSPGSGSTLADYVNNFTWMTSGFDAAPMCSMRIYKPGNSTPLYTYSINCAKNSQCNQGVQNLQEGIYAWNATCSAGIQNASSQAGSFTIDYDSACVLDLPPDPHSTTASAVNFQWFYSRFYSPPACTLIINGNPSSVSCSASPCSKNVTAMAEGSYVWGVNCTYKNQTAACPGARSLTIGYALSANLVSPGPGAGLALLSNNFTWAASGFDSAPQCTMRIYNSSPSVLVRAYPVSCANGAECSKPVDSLLPGSYYWNVNCTSGVQQKISENRAFTVTYSNAVLLGSPIDGEATNLYDLPFTWNAIGFAGTPSCSLYIDGSLKWQGSNASGQFTSTISGMAQGGHTWYAECIYGIQNTRSISRAFNIVYSGLSCAPVSPPDNTEIQNQSMKFTWLPSGFGGNPACTLRVRNATTAISTTPSCVNGAQCSVSLTNLLVEGDYTWFVNCTYGAQNAASAPRSLRVKYQLSMWPVSPSDGVELSNYTNSMFWQASGFDSAPRCMINIYSQAGTLVFSGPAYPGALCAAGSDCGAPVSNLAQGQYSWNATCSQGLQKASSATRTFSIKYNSTCSLYSPIDNGAIRANTNTGPANAALFWDTNGFSGAPTCTVSVYNFTARIAYLSKACPAAGRCGMNASLQFGNDYRWNVTCGYGNQMAASQTRAFSFLPSSASCVLFLPENGATMLAPFGGLPNVYLQWIVYGFGSAHGCNLSVNGMNTVIPYSTDQSQGTYQSLPLGSYSWRVSCYNSSDLVSCGGARTLSVSRAVTLLTPVNGTQTAAWRLNFSWTPSGFNTAVNATCALQITGQSGFTYSNSAICSPLGRACSIMVGGLPIDSYSWSVTCSNTRGESTRSATNSLRVMLSQSPLASCSILLPPENGTVFSTKPAYSWRISGMQAQRSCALLVDGVEIYSSPDSMDTIYSYVSLLSASYGSHTWNVVCSNDLERATCGPARFNISRFVSLISPPGAGCLSTWVSNFSWAPIGFTGFSSCAIGIYNSTSLAFSNSTRCPASGNCSQPVTGLAPGSYQWNVTCSNSTLGQYGSSSESSFAVARSQSASCSIISPLNGEALPNRSIISPNVNYAWNVSGFSGAHACTLIIDGSQRTDIPYGSVNLHSLPSIAEQGRHSWEVSCYNATETASCGLAEFDVGTNVALYTPSANAVVNSWSINFTWVPVGFQAGAFCFLNIDGREFGSRPCAPGVRCAEPNIHLDVGKHNWSVSCMAGTAQITSQTNYFNVTMPESSARCDLASPIGGADIQSTHGYTNMMTYTWYAIGFTSDHACDLILNSRVSPLGFWDMREIYTKDANLDPGNYEWSVVCYNDSVYSLCGPRNFTVSDLGAEVVAKSPLLDSATNAASVLFSWMPYQFIADPTCALNIEGPAPQQVSISCANDVDCERRYPLSEGAYQWSVNCSSILTDGAIKGADSGAPSPFKVDRTPPGSIISANNSAGPYNFGEPSNDPVQVSIGCSDGLSGCDKTYYCVDFTEGCIPATIYSGAFPVAQFGYLSFYSMDKAGNAEDSRTVFIHVKTDFAPPTTTVTATTSMGIYGFGQVSYDPVTVSAQCSDPQSGCADTLYCVGESNCVPQEIYSQPISFSEYGSKYIRIYSKDLDNNFENPVQTLLVIYSPPPPPPPGVSGCTTYTASSYNIVPVAGVLAACIVGLAFMFSQKFQNPQLEAWAKNEWKELIVAGLTVGLVYSAALVMTHDINGILTGQGDRDTLISFADSKFSEFRGELLEDYRMTIIVANRIGILTSYSYTSGFGGLSLYFGQNAAPYSGAGSLVSMLSGLAGSISNGIMVYDAMLLFLRFFFCASYQMILPLGFAFRLMPFTRKVGGTLIALALGGIFIYPFSMVLVATIHENIGVQHSLITPEDLDLITIHLSNIITEFCTNDFIRYFTAINEWGWWLIICTPYCIAYTMLTCSAILATCESIATMIMTATSATCVGPQAAACLAAVAAQYAASMAECAADYAICIPETFWECWMPLDGTCWNISYYFYTGVQAAIQYASTLVAVTSSEAIKNAVQGDLGKIYDTVVDHLVIPVANAAVLPIMEAVLVGGLTIVGTRGLSAALNGDVSLSGLERLI